MNNKVAAVAICIAMAATGAYAQIAMPAYSYISTVAGDGTAGYSGDSFLATDTELNNPAAIAVDGSGNIYIADFLNCRVRKVTASTGIISTVAGNGTCGYSGDLGLAINAELNHPTGVAVDASGNLYIADFDNCSIREVSGYAFSPGGVPQYPAGTIITQVGQGPSHCGYNGDGGEALASYLSGPYGVAVDSNGNLYIGDYGNARIRKVTISPAFDYPWNPFSAAGSIITTVAGNGTGGYNGDNQLATNAKLYGPTGVSLDGYGNIYIADSGNNRIREVTVSTGMISTVAGYGAAGYSGDGGLATLAKLNYPIGVATDVSGNIYIADYANSRIRMVTNGNITTVAGDGSAGYSGDGGLATSAELNNPEGVALDGSANLYIADYKNNRIRAVGGELLPSTFNPFYKVVSILYSPPGNQSFQGYGQSSTTGTTTTVGTTFSEGYSAGLTLNIFGLTIGGSYGNSTTKNNSQAFTENFTDATTMTTNDNNNTTYNPTAANSINHNLDTFEIWLNPLVTFESNGATPVSYTVAAQPTTVNGVPSPYADIIGVPAIAMEATSANITALNPSGVAGITTVPVELLEPIAIAQDPQPPFNGANAYMPGLGAICANNTLYQQHLAANLAGNPNPQICTQTNQCGCTPADFASVLQTDPLLNYNDTTYTASPYDGTVSPLQADTLSTSSGPGSGPGTCGLNAVPTTANCRYVVVPYTGTNTPETANELAVPWIQPLAGVQYPNFQLTDQTVTAETIGGSSSSTMGVNYGYGPIKGQNTWTWTDSESIGSSYTTGNSMSVTLKTTNDACSENISIFEDTVYHTFAFQEPVGNTTCNPPTFSVAVTPNGVTQLPMGSSISYAINVSSLNEFTGTVALSVSGLPTGVTAIISPTSITTSGTATLTLTAASGSSTYLGASAITVTGTSGSSNVTATFPLTTVNPSTPAPNISYTASCIMALDVTPLSHGGGGGGEVTTYTVKILDSASNASIYYTLDGTQATASSTPYTSTFNIAPALFTTVTINAVAIVPISGESAESSLTLTGAILTTCKNSPPPAP